MNQLICAISILFNFTLFQPYYIGEVGEAWRFPSDHLPIGATIDEFHIVCWNILNKKYLSHIEENAQGLKNSSILKDNVSVEESLTLRELKASLAIMEMATHPTHPRALIALQETHEDVQKYLKSHLPSSWKVLTPPNQPNSQDLFFYDTHQFEFISLDAKPYTENMPKSIFTITLRSKTSGKVYRFIQSHIPGGPNSQEGCAKFAKEAVRQFDFDMTIVLMGDMNQSPEVIQRALDKESIGSQIYSYLPITYPSHINTKMEASWIDNLFIYNKDSVISSSSDPIELFDGLKPIVKLLSKQ